MRFGLIFAASLMAGHLCTARIAAAQLLVSSGDTQDIKKFDPTTGTSLGVFATGGGLSGPQQMAQGPDGSIFIAGSGWCTNCGLPADAIATSRNVLRYDGSTGSGKPSTGNSGAVFITAGTAGLLQPIGVAMGPDGNLYVADTGDTTGGNLTGGKILRFDRTTGAPVGTGLFASGGGLSVPAGILFGPDGNLYVCEDFGGSILRFNGFTGAPMPSAGNSGATFVAAGAGGLSRPSAIAFGPDGRLYVSGGATNAVLRFDQNTGAFLSVFSNSHISVPIGVAFGPDGNLYVANSGSNTVARFSGSTGAYIDNFSVSSISYLLFEHPAAASSVLLVTSNTQILQFDSATGTPLGTFAAGGGLSVAQTMAIGPDGNLYVASSQAPNAFVARYNGTTGQPMPSTGNSGAVFAQGGNLVLPYGLAFGPDGNLYVSDYGPSDGSFPAIRRYNSTTGAFLNVFASGGGLVNPAAITFGPDGNLYVSNDLGGNSILRYDAATGQPLPSGGNSGATFVPAGSGGLVRPQGLTFGADRNLYVASRSGAVLRYDGVTGAFKDVFASTNLSTAPEGLVFGPDRNLYVSDLVGSDVVRYDGTTGSFSGYFVPTANNGGLNQNTYLLFKNTPSPGRITVTTNLSSATFTISGPSNYLGTGTSFLQPNAALGTYTITFAAATGYLTPASQNQTLAAGGTIAFTGLFQTLPMTPATANLGQPGSSPRNPSPYASEPVNTATGNYYSTNTDLAVPGRGLSILFVRSYNSADSYSGPLGIGWTHSFNVVLLKNADGTVSIKDTDGGIIGFAPSAGGFAPSTPGVFDSLQQTSDGSLKLTRKNQTLLSFSSSGQLASIIDRNNNSQLLSYTGGSLTSITDSGGRTYSLLYDGSAHLIEIRDPLGRTLQYAYDSSGRLTSFEDATGATTIYAYDGNNRLVSATDRRGNIYLQNTNDSQGRVVNQQNARGFTTTFAYNTPASGTTTITDPLGNVTKDVLDGSGRLSQRINALGGTTSYSYDSNNLSLTITDPLGHTQSFTYDKNGNTVSATDSAGKVASFTYDGNNDLLSSTDRLGRTTALSYDSKGNLLTTVGPTGAKATFTYDAYGQMATAKNPLGFTTSLQYDPAGNPTKITDALGGNVITAYDAVGRVSSIQNQLGKTTATSYDADNRLLTLADPLGNTTQFNYDGNGNLTKQTDARGNVTTYAYDSTNKRSRVTDATGGITQYQYDGNTNLTAMTDANGHTTAYGYDALQRRQSITDPLGRQKRYTYDAGGNATTSIDGNGKTNTFAYDSLNRLTSINPSDGKTVGYTFDANGNRATMNDWRGATAYLYDTLNRVVSVNTPDGAAVAYTYDAGGNRTALIYPDGRVFTYTYDALNRLSKATDWAGNATSYTYDAGGNLLGFVHPNGATSAYQYDAAGRLLSVVNKSGSATLSSFTYVLDQVGNRLQTTTNANGINKYGYDELYRLASWAPPSGQVTTWNYDAVGNRTTMTSTAGTTKYAYDKADELLSAGTTAFTYDGNGNQQAKTTGSTTLTYGWDALNRLIAVAGGSTNTLYKYDGDGNRVGQQIPSGSYSYVNDTAARLPVVLNESGPDGNITYEYGNSLIGASSSAFQYYHQFDGLGSTINLTDSSGAQKANYAYDPWGKLTLPLDPVGNKDKYKFTTEQNDSSTGLIYLRARYYDPSVGRLFGKDARSFGLSSQGINRYIYGMDNPIRYIDPSGHSVEVAASMIADTNITTSGTTCGTLDCLSGTGALSDLAEYGAVGRQVSAFHALGIVGALASVGSDYADHTVTPDIRAGRAAFDVALYGLSLVPQFRIANLTINVVCAFTSRGCNAVKDQVTTSLEYPLSDPLPATTPVSILNIP